MDLIYFILTAYGMTQIIISGTIFDKIRPSKEWLAGTGQVFTVPCAWAFGWEYFCGVLMG